MIRVSMETVMLSALCTSSCSYAASDDPPLCWCAGVLLVYFSGYLIETTGSWATVFALITSVNLLGLCTFLAFAEARRFDVEFSRIHHHNSVHI